MLEYETSAFSPVVSAALATSVSADDETGKNSKASLAKYYRKHSAGEISNGTSSTSLFGLRKFSRSKETKESKAERKAAEKAEKKAEQRSRANKKMSAPPSTSAPGVVVLVNGMQPSAGVDRSPPQPGGQPTPPVALTDEEVRIGLLVFHVLLRRNDRRGLKRDSR